MKKKAAQTVYTKQATYAKSGVNIDEGDALVDKIRPLVRKTMRAGADVEIGGFGGLFDLAKIKYRDPILVSSTDGVGTKLRIATILGQHDNIGTDLVAMCVNDIVVQGAEPLFFLDYYATGKLDSAKASLVIKGIAEGCKEAGCALIGGETAEMPGIYHGDDYDLAGFSVGVVERDNILPKNNIRPGDILIGIASSGVHSNGYSLVRYIINNHILPKNKDSDNESIRKKLNNVKIGGKSLGSVLLEPTRIYVKPCLELAQNGFIKGMAHITGGGITENLPRILPKNTVADINPGSWDIPEIFKWLEETGDIAKEEMLRTFNYGIGMILVTAKNHVNKVENILKKYKERYFIIGEISETSKKESFVNYK